MATKRKAKRRASISAVDFVKVFAPMAKQGKSALEIGKELGMTGDEKKISVAVSVKASQLRKQLGQAAEAMAAEKDLDEKATAELVETMQNKLPRLKGSGRGRKRDTNELLQAIDAALDQLDGDATE